jgi:hypothetical protein
MTAFVPSSVFDAYINVPELDAWSAPFRVVIAPCIAPGAPIGCDPPHPASNATATQTLSA